MELGKENVVLFYGFMKLTLTGKVVKCVVLYSRFHFNLYS